MLDQSEIEQIKLRSTYYNNISVGLLLAGLLIPYLGIVQHLGTIVGRLTHGPTFTTAEIQDGLSSLGAMVLALSGARRLRRMASEALEPLGHKDQNSN